MIGQTTNELKISKISSIPGSWNQSQEMKLLNSYRLWDSYRNRRHQNRTDWSAVLLPFIGWHVENQTILIKKLFLFKDVLKIIIYFFLQIFYATNPWAIPCKRKIGAGCKLGHIRQILTQPGSSPHSCRCEKAPGIAARIDKIRKNRKPQHTRLNISLIVRLTEAIATNI